jgi:hypothetical protein
MLLFGNSQPKSGKDKVIKKHGQNETYLSVFLVIF